MSSGKTTEQINQEKKQAQYQREQAIRTASFQTTNNKNLNYKLDLFFDDFKKLKENYNNSQHTINTLMERLTETATRLESALDVIAEIFVYKEFFPTKENFLNEVESKTDNNFHRRKLDAEEDTIKIYDTVCIDAQGFIDGKPDENMKIVNKKFQLNYQTFIPAFENAIVGMKPGESATKDVTFPENYPQANIAGKTFPFEFKVKFAYRDTIIEQRVLEAEHQERKSLTSQLQFYGGENKEELTIQELRDEVARLRKAFEEKQKVEMTTEYLTLTGNKPDHTWTIDRLHQEVTKLKEAIKNAKSVIEVGSDQEQVNNQQGE